MASLDVHGDVPTLVTEFKRVDALWSCDCNFLCGRFKAQCGTYLKILGMVVLDQARGMDMPR